jgi:hypothetical protein
MHSGRLTPSASTIRTWPIRVAIRENGATDRVDPHLIFPGGSLKSLAGILPYISEMQPIEYLVPVYFFCVC